MRQLGSLAAGTGLNRLSSVLGKPRAAERLTAKAA